jgi:nucleotide-binding universal stress UspA family protein
MIRIKKILCPIDFSPAALKAADYAAALAKNYGAKIQLLHVIAPVAYYEYGLSPVDTIKAMEEASSAEMKKLVTRLTAKGVSVQTKVRTGDVRDETRRSISAAKPDLIAMGTHGRRGFARWVMGSVTEWMMRHSPVPVLTISAKETITKPVFRQILVTTDFSEGSADALAYAVSIGETAKSKITLLHVINRLTVEIPDTYRDMLVAGAQKELNDLILAAATSTSHIVTRVEHGVPYRIILRILRTENPTCS